MSSRLKIIAINELVVSDYGMNGSLFLNCKKHYRDHLDFAKSFNGQHLFTFQSARRWAAGEYFLLLADDDEISSSYVSQLVAALERNLKS